MKTGWHKHLIIGTVTVTVMPTQAATVTIAPIATNTAIPATPTPAPGVCDPSVNITVGSHAGYPGEWDADFHPSASAC